MKKILMLLLSFSFLSCSGQEEAKLYRTTGADKGEPVTTYHISGEYPSRVDLDRPIEIKEKYGFSKMNDNSEYDFFLYTPQLTQNTRTVLKVGEQYYYLSRNDARQDQLACFSTRVTADHAQKIAAALEIELADRAPLGYKLKSRFVPNKPSYEVGDTVRLRFEIQNVGDVAVIVNQGGRNRGSYRHRCEYFSFEATNEKGEKVKDQGEGKGIDLGGLEGRPTVEPGKNLEMEVDLSKWFVFDEPGVYTVSCRYELFVELPSEKLEREDYLRHAHERWDDELRDEIVVEVK